MTPPIAPSPELALAAPEASTAPKVSVIHEPATVAACRRDYEAAAEARAAFTRQQQAKRTR